MENTQNLPAKQIDEKIVESLVLQGDLSRLAPSQKVQYYNSLCERLGLDPLTQPFGLLKLNGKEQLYALKNATQQLSKIYNISHEKVSESTVNDVFMVCMRAKDKDGRYTDDLGAVNIAGLKGDSLANAMMKCYTKASRRSTLSHVGLGFLDESELDTVPQATPIPIEEKQTDDRPSAEYLKLHSVFAMARSIEELATLWKSNHDAIGKLTQQEKEKLTALKDERKAKLTPKAEVVAVDVVDDIPEIFKDDKPEEESELKSVIPSCYVIKPNGKQMHVEDYVLPATLYKGKKVKDIPIEKLDAVIKSKNKAIPTEILTVIERYQKQGGLPF